MAGVASLGALETGYLTLTKLSGGQVLCPTNGQCASVLNGAWASIPYTNIPLSLMGFFAYATVAALAIGPVLFGDEDDSTNRILLLVMTTAMGTFSTFLMTLLFTYLQQSCPFCLASATFSWTLAASAWLGGAIPETRVRLALKSSLATFATVTAATAIFFVSVTGGPVTTASSDPYLAFDETDGGPRRPPAIIADSTDRSLQIARELKTMDSRMFGAYWCPHCFDQKETLGQEAFTIVDYIECGENGYNAQPKLCNSKKLPGYPTWEIAGQLYPGEKTLDDLEGIVREAKESVE